MFFICHKCGRKIISYNTDMTQTCYIQRPMYMTSLILKLKTKEDISLKIMNLKSKAS